MIVVDWMKMHEPYEDDDYDENDNYEYPYNPYKWYYKFDIDSNTPLSDWINQVVNNFLDPFGKGDWKVTNISGLPNNKFPVNSWNPNTGKDNTYQYLGSNYDNIPLWKKKYFVIDHINNHYKSHLQNHASHFLRQPHYYKGMFDILN